MRLRQYRPVSPINIYSRTLFLRLPQYEIWTTAPSVVTGGLNVKLVAQLGPRAVAADWQVDLYEFIGKDDWTNIGDLTGGELPISSCSCPMSYQVCCIGLTYSRHLFSFVDIIFIACYCGPLLKLSLFFACPPPAMVACPCSYVVRAHETVSRLVYMMIP